MTEQINMDNLILNIMYGLQDVIGEQERLNQAKMVLYMHLSGLQILRGEETALSTELDNTGEWVRLYLVTMSLKGCTTKSIQAYQQEYKMFFGYVNKSVADITVNDIRQYLAYCKLTRHNNDVTINNKIRYLNGLFSWLLEEEYISKNPMIKIKSNRVERKVKEVFTDEQVTLIRDAAMRKSIRDLAIVDFLHTTGARISEVVALNRDMIDFKDRECIVYGKGRKERPVYFSGDAAVHLKDYLDSRTDDNLALFVGLRRPFKRLTDDGVRAMLKSLCEGDKRLEGVAANPHKWRRQFVTELLERDVPLQLVADLVGHTSVDTTKQSYANYSKNKAREAHRKYIA